MDYRLEKVKNLLHKYTTEEFPAAQKNLSYYYKNKIYYIESAIKLLEKEAKHMKKAKKEWNESLYGFSSNIDDNNTNMNGGKRRRITHKKRN